MSAKFHFCDMVKAIRAKWEMPLYFPITFGEEDGILTSNQLALKVFNLTSSGRMSKRDPRPATMFLNYCPFCGEKLRDDEDR